MEVKWYKADANGKVNVDGLIFKVRENVKYKNYLNAMNDINRIKNIIALGIFSFIAGLFFLLGSVGRVEFYSLIADTPDTWNMGNYILLDSIGTVLFLVGIFVIKWGWSKETIYQRWIDEYLGQNNADEEAV